MKILFVGKSDFKYNRVNVLLEGLRKLDGIEVILCPIVKRDKAFVKRFQELSLDVDCIYIPPFRHRDVAYIKRYAKKPVVFDPLISKYMTIVSDYGRKWKAPFKYFLDKVPFIKCDYLLADTSAHKDYFSSKFKVPADKISVLPIGSNVSEFFPIEREKTSMFHVGFVGSFIPLQGVINIAKAAVILKDETDICFDMIGTGHDYKPFVDIVKENNLTHVNMFGHVKYNVLNEAINTFDVCLGIFGDSIKTDIVVPNKIWNYASVGIPIITKETKGVCEIFEDRRHLFLCDGTPEDIAKCIKYVKDNRDEAALIANNAYKLISEDYSEISIAQRFLAILKRTL